MTDSVNVYNLILITELSFSSVDDSLRKVKFLKKLNFESIEGNCCLHDSR